MATATRVGIRLKTVALPNEHGAWAFLLEPALLGLLLAPSLVGAVLVLAALAALLAQHPLSLVLADWRRGKSYPRTALAMRFAVGYGSAAAAAFATAVLLAGGVSFLFPALLVAPLALVQLALDSRNQGRSLTAELCGATAISALAPLIMLVGRGDPVAALAIWLLLAARNVSSILYVRTRLRLEYGRPAAVYPPVAAQLVALSLIAWMTVTGPLPYLALAAFLILAGRALLGLSRFRRPTAPNWIGVRELLFGLLLVALTSIGMSIG